MAAKYSYIYDKDTEGYPSTYRAITIYLPKTDVSMYLDSDLPNHTQMVQTFDSSVTSLEKYVDYLGDDPNRPFNLPEILTIIQ
jgi:hypothetical protein